MGIWIVSFSILVVSVVALFLIFDQYKKTVREAKDYERGLKMVPMKIHLPPPSDDIESGSRDERDVVDETLSQAQTMYNIISSTATKGFKTKLYGQRHISFEIIANDGLIHYYAVVPAVITETVKQAISAAYPTARLEEVELDNIFSDQGKSNGVIGGEFTLKKDFIYPISTYEESKRDASRALLDALSRASRGDGIAVQFMLRPAFEGWTQKSIDKVDSLRDSKGKAKKSAALDIMEALWKPPQSTESESKNKQLTSLEESEIDAIEKRAEGQIAQAVADADHARAVSDGLHDEAAKLAARLAASERARRAATASESATGTTGSELLAELFRRADQRAGELAAIADQARIRGLTCEAAYDALTGASAVET